jgi:hypothetical protein
MKNNINLDLNRLPYWSHSECTRCGRMYPEVLLNIEGVIHHKIKMECVDLKDCQKYIKKNKKRSK